MSQVILHTIALGTISVISMFFIIWVVHIFLKNAGVVDVGWGLGFMILCGIYVLMGEGFNLRNTILFLMVSLWGLRIVLFLFKRLTLEGHEDRRYQKIRKEWGGNVTLKFLFFFEFQAVLEIILAIPFLIVSLNPASGLSVLEIFGVIIFSVALIGETIADEQLQSFKNNSENKGKTCNVGLWNYSRHPNYFFEWLVWMGIFVFAIASPYGWVSFVSPLLMYYLMVYVSGVPLAEEQSILSRGDNYREYQKTTSMFFPMPKRKIKEVL